MSSTQPETMKPPPNITLPIITTPNSITATTIMPPIIAPTTITTSTLPAIATPPTIQTTPIIVTPSQHQQQPQLQPPPQAPSVTVAAVAATTLATPTTTVTPAVISTPNISTPIPQPPQSQPPPTTNTALPALNLTQVQQAPLALLKPIKFICCLLDNGIRCDRVAGNASFSLKIQKIVGTKGMNIALDPTVRHTYICEHHKAVITVAKKATTVAREPQVRQLSKVSYAHVNQTGGDNIASSSSGADVDLQQLQVNTLRRYKRHFRIQTKPGLNKMQLAESLKGHFRTLPIIEKEAITYFVYIVKCYRNKLDHNPKEFD